MGKRIRSRDLWSRSPVTRRIEYWYAMTCGETPAYRWSQDLVSYVDRGSKAWMLDYDTPGFYKKRRRGEVSFNPMKRAVVTISDAGGNSVIETQSIMESCTGSSKPYKQKMRNTAIGGSFAALICPVSFPTTPSDGSPPCPSLDISGSAIQSALKEAATAVLGKRGLGDTNLSETLAEIHKSLGLLDAILGNGLRTISKAAPLLSRAKSLGSAYLAYRYGLAPLMKDVEAVVKGIDKKLGVVRSTSRATVSLTGFSSQTTQYSAYGNGYPVVTQSVDSDWSARMMCLDTVDADVLFNIGLTQKGMMGLPWELIPYSFVVDWFVNVGDYIYSLLPALGLVPLGSCYTVTHHRVDTWAITGYNAVSGNTVITAPSGSVVRDWTYSERILGLPQSGLVFKHDFRFDRFTRIADAIALIVQRLR